MKPAPHTGTSGSELSAGVDVEFVTVVLGDRNGLGDGWPEDHAKTHLNGTRREMALKAQ